MIIIGLTGTIAAGKSTVADVLKEKGFEHYTYSNILRMEAEKRKIPPTRKNLQDLGNKIKQESGNLGILSRLLIENAETGKIIADGIRTVDEVKELKKHPNAYVIAVDAPPKLRYERLKSRKREGDPESFDEFIKIDEHENKGLTPGQEINKCIRHADFTLINDKGRKRLKKEVLDILEKISRKSHQPS
ncbi:dephospho-CoA kinase [Candidatus Woesearchaeota archaeon]|nr:dephospho-CoA kinase [Candidatus Woesearchaeota archaeon]